MSDTTNKIQLLIQARNEVGQATRDAAADIERLNATVTGTARAGAASAAANTANAQATAAAAQAARTATAATAANTQATAAAAAATKDQSTSAAAAADQTDKLADSVARFSLAASDADEKGRGIVRFIAQMTGLGGLESGLNRVTQRWQNLTGYVTTGIAVMGAALAGWKIGTVIRDITGLGNALDNAMGVNRGPGQTSSLMRQREAFEVRWAAQHGDDTTGMDDAWKQFVAAGEQARWQRENADRLIQNAGTPTPAEIVADRLRRREVLLPTDDRQAQAAVEEMIRIEDDKQREVARAEAAAADRVAAARRYQAAADAEIAAIDQGRRIDAQVQSEADALRARLAPAITKDTRADYDTYISAESDIRRQELANQETDDTEQLKQARAGKLADLREENRRRLESALTQAAADQSERAAAAAAADEARAAIQAERDKAAAARATEKALHDQARAGAAAAAAAERAAADLSKQAAAAKEAAAAAWQIAVANLHGAPPGNDGPAERRAARDADRTDRIARNRLTAAQDKGAVNDSDGIWRDRFGKAFARSTQGLLDADAMARDAQQQADVAAGQLIQQGLAANPPPAQPAPAPAPLAPRPDDPVSVDPDRRAAFRKEFLDALTNPDMSDDDVVRMLDDNRHLNPFAAADAGLIMSEGDEGRSKIAQALIAGGTTLPIAPPSASEATPVPLADSTIPIPSGAGIGPDAGTGAAGLLEAIARNTAATVAELKAFHLVG